MKKITYYLPEESDTPLPPEGFHIIGYTTLLLEPIEAKEIGAYDHRIESYNYATLPIRLLEDNLMFVCVASDENISLYQSASIVSGIYEGTWLYLDDGTVFNLDEYREANQSPKEHE